MIPKFVRDMNKTVIPDDILNQESYYLTKWESDPALTPGESLILDSFFKEMWTSTNF